MTEIPEIFTPNPEEALRLESIERELIAAKESFLGRKQHYESQVGIFGKTLGKIGLWRATREARRHGLTIFNGRVIMPRVVSLAYFNALDDDVFSIDDRY